MLTPRDARRGTTTTRLLVPCMELERTVRVADPAELPLRANDMVQLLSGMYLDRKQIKTTDGVSVVG
jgi:hypothetical protein